MGYFSIVLPVGKTNLCTNPSLELGTTGWGTISGGTVGTTSALQAFGVMAGSVAPANNGTSGVLAPTFAASNGSAYAYSFYGSFPVGSVFRAGIGDTNGASLQGSFIGTGGGTWQRYAGSFTESAGASRRLAIRKNANAATDAFYIDAVQYELGSITTYLDGDTPGCAWDGAPHLSASVRPPTVRTGGTLVNLNDIGVSVLEAPGMGMPDLEVITQDYAYLDGGFYQRTRAGQRTMSLLSLMSGTTWQGLHAIRRTYIDALRPDRTPTPQPYRIYYTGAGGTLTIDAVVEAGLGFDSREGFSETAGVRMISVDPYWKTELEEGTTLAPQIALGSTNYLAYRSPTGVWGTLGVNGTTVNQTSSSTEVIRALAYNLGTLYVAGELGTAAGTPANGFTFYAGGVFGTFPGGTVNAASAGAIRDLAIDSVGTIYAGGAFTTASGSAHGRALARYTNGSWLPLVGTVNGGGILYLLMFGGTLFASGVQTSVNGTTVDGAGMYNTLSGSWGTMAIPNTGGPIIADLSGTIYMGTHKWTSPTNFSQLNIPVAMRGYGIDAAGNIYFSAGGGTLYNGVSAMGIAKYNGVSFSALGSGLMSGAGTGFARRITQLKDGRMLASGSFNIVNGQTWFPRGLAYWTGGAWVPSDINLANGAVLDAVVLADGGVYAGGTFFGTATAAAVATIVTPASGAINYPTFTFRTPNSGTARIYQLVNTTTNDALYFNLVLQPTETATLKTSPGSVSFTSNLRGNLLSAILPSSNIANWRLLPGTNTVSLFSDNATLRTDLVYLPKFWSSDGL